MNTLATDKWFNFLDEQILTEGLDDIGLPDNIVSKIRVLLPNSSEKGRVWVGNAWKLLNIGDLIHGESNAIRMMTATQVYDYVDIRDAPALLKQLHAQHPRPGLMAVFGTPHAQILELYTGLLEPVLDPTGGRAKAGAPYAVNDEFTEKYLRILKNYRNLLATGPLGKNKKLIKSLMKQLVKLSKAYPYHLNDNFLGSAYIDYNKLYIDLSMDYLYRKYEDIFVFLENNPKNYEMIKNVPPADIDAAHEIAGDYILSLELPEQIIHKFEDGSYWYNLESSTCELEGARMGHCGEDRNGILISLRKHKKGRRTSSSYVTLAYNEESNTIFQIKGRENSAPPEEVWDHIVWFIDNMNVTSVEEEGQHSSDDFEPLLNHLKHNTSADVGGTEKKFEEFTESINGLLEARNFLEAGVGIQVDTDYGDAEFGGTDFYWNAYTSFIAMELPFFLTKELIEYSLQERDSDEDPIYKILLEHDSAGALAPEAWAFDWAWYFVNAGGGAPLDRDPDLKRYAAAKALKYHQGGHSDAERAMPLSARQHELTRGKTPYLVLVGINEAIDHHWSYSDGRNYDDDSFYDFCDMIAELAMNVEDSLDEIETYLKEAGAVKETELDRLSSVEFHNFDVAKTPDKRGYIFKLKEEDWNDLIPGMNAGMAKFLLTRPNLFLDKWKHTSTHVPYSGPRATGAFENADFTIEFYKNIASLEQDAIKYANKQLQLDFGPKYKDVEIKPLFAQGKRRREPGQERANIFTGVAYRGPYVHSITDQNSDDAASFKLQFVITLYPVPGDAEKTLEAYSSFLEYIDNHIKEFLSAASSIFKNILKKEVAAWKRNTAGPPAWEPDLLQKALREAENPLDVRLYSMDLIMSYPLGRGFEITDIHNMVRAIPQITTVRTTKKRRVGTLSVTEQNIKFALKGQASRKDFVKYTLLPQIRKIDARIKILRMSKIDLFSSKHTLKEYYSMAMQDPPSVTPRRTIGQIADDWSEGGVMYDVPMNTNYMGYHTMMPVEELRPYISRYFRKPKNQFDAGYEDFIKYGPDRPVYLAIGQNGKAKITGGEDLVWYAIKSGLEEIPVFFSYQKQI